MIFIHYLENAFKYGVSTEVESTIYFHINISAHCLKLWVKNHKFLKENWAVSTNIGMKNSKQHLDSLYAGRYELKINENEEIFEVNLTLDFT